MFRTRKRELLKIILAVNVGDLVSMNEPCPAMSVVSLLRTGKVCFYVRKVLCQSVFKEAALRAMRVRLITNSVILIMYVFVYVSS